MMANYQLGFHVFHYFSIPLISPSNMYNFYDNSIVVGFHTTLQILLFYERNEATNYSKQNSILLTDQCLDQTSSERFAPGWGPTDVSLFHFERNLCVWGMTSE